MVKCEKMMIEQQTPISGNSNENNNNSNSSKKKYKGVRMRSWGSWVSEIRAPNQKTRIWLGSYSTADAAARAYDAALLCLKGSSASLNFPNSSRLYQNDIPQDVVLSPKSIQRVAAAAAASAGADSSNIGSAAATIPDNCSCSSSSSSSSSSMVSSPSDCYHVEDQFDDRRQHPMAAVMEALCSFDAGFDQYSPTMMTMMMASSCLNDPQMMVDPYEEGGDDIRLWSFC